MSGVLHAFKELGMSEYETRSYISLLQTPRMTAPALARETQIPTAKIYDVLSRMVLKGIVMEEPGKPRRFRGLDPELVIKSIIGSKRTALEELEVLVRDTLFKMAQGRDDSGIWIIRGRENVEMLLDRTVAKTKQKLLIRYSPGTMCLEKVIDLLKGNFNGVEIDSKLNDVNINIVNSDGREMVIYMNKKEALWIKDSKHCKTIEQMESKYAEAQN